MKIAAYAIGALLALAAAGCVGPPERMISDDALRIAASDARTFYNDGDIRRALAHYEKALARAVWLDDAEQIGRMSLDAAACASALSQFQRAHAWVDQAEYEWSRMARSPAPVYLQRAQIFLREKRRDEAVQWADRAYEGETAPDTRATALLIKARAALDGESGDDALVPLGLARTQVEMSRNRNALLIQWYETYALLYGRKGDFEQAAAMEKQAMDLRRDSGRYAGLAESMTRLADYYRSAERWDEAVDFYYRAARRLQAQGRPLEALPRINRAAEMAPLTEDRGWADRLDDLLKTIETSMREE